MAEQTDKTENPIESRVGRLEAGYQHLDESLSQFRREVRENNTALFAKLDQLSNSRQITLPLIFSGVATLVAVAGIAGVLHMQSLSPIHKELSETNKFQQFFLEDYAPEMYVKSGMNSEKFRTIKAELNAAIVNRRDMSDRLLDMNNRVQSDLDRLRQVVENGLGPRVEDKTASVRAEVRALEKRLDDFTSMVKEQRK